MEFNKPIADMLPGMDVEGFYILRAAALKTTNNGKPFLSGTICDRTGRSRSGTTAARSARARTIPAAS
jgi:23S rRNA maturation-related 3'-5' exoribonuclease YhaM